MANEYLNNQTFEDVIRQFQMFKRKKARCQFILKDTEETNRRQKKRKKNNNETLKDQRKEYQHACEEFEKYQGELTQAFYILSENIANYYINRYSGIDIDDATQEAVLICFEKVDRFNPDKGRAFNYMTTCIINHFRQIYRSNRNYNELKKKYHNYLQDRFESMFRRNGKERSGSDYSFMN